jgi:hypothetical protein
MQSKTKIKKNLPRQSAKVLQIKNKEKNKPLPTAYVAVNKAIVDCLAVAGGKGGLCRLDLCHLAFAACHVDCSRQRICRLQSCLCRLLLAVGKEGESGSVQTIYFVLQVKNSCHALRVIYG